MKHRHKRKLPRKPTQDIVVRHRKPKVRYTCDLEFIPPGTYPMMVWYSAYDRVTNTLSVQLKRMGL